MDAYIQNIDPLPTTEQQLRSAVIAAAANIPHDNIVKAIASLYGRCKKCIEVNGARFEYKF